MKERPHGRIAASMFLAVGALIASGAGLAADIEIGDAWSRPTPPGVDVGAAYFTITSRGRNYDRLVGVSSPIAKRAELHVSRMEGGVMKMRHLNAVEVKPGTPTAFEPSGRHVMLVGLKKPLKRGESFPLVLKFANAGSVEVQVKVGDKGGTAAASGMNMDPSMKSH